MTPRWLIDLTVWCLIAVSLAAMTWMVFEVTRPPTFAEMQQAARSDFLGKCRQKIQGQDRPGQMVESYCQCVLNRGAGGFGISDEANLACLQRAARGVASDGNVGQVFASKFPGACQSFERDQTHRFSSQNSTFCQCLQASVSQDRERMAQYAFAGWEADSKARQESYQTCGSSLLYGAGWSVLTDGTDTWLAMQLPGFFTADVIEFRCDGHELSLHMRDMRSNDREGDVTFVDEVDNRFSAAANSGGGDVRRVIDALRFADGPGVTSPQTKLVFGDRALNLTLAEFTKKSDQLLAKCPASALPAVASDTASDLPDMWEQTSGARAEIKENNTFDWTASLVCDDGPQHYLALSAAAFEALAEQFPDPSGDFHAIGVPVELNGRQMGDDGATCTWGDGGAEETCYVAIDPESMRSLARDGELKATVAGIKLGPVAFGNSTAVKAVLPACLS